MILADPVPAPPEAPPSPTLGVRTLYICYFGFREPLVHTQVLPYIRQLAEAGAQVWLLTFEPEMRQRWTPEAVEKTRRELEVQGIRWQMLPYHKRPSLPATLYDIAAGARFAAGLIKRERIDVLHGRAHVATAMAALAKRLTGAKLIFDIRGFNAEEYVDAGVWRDGDLKYRLTKAAERALLKAADGFVVLTERARDILFPGGTDTEALGRPVEVIPCCVDFERFAKAQTLDRDRVRAELGLTGRRVLVYVGALGGFYLTDEMAEFLAAAHRRDPKTYTLVLTQSPPEMIAGALRRLGVSERDFQAKPAPPAEVPRYLRAADAALSFVKPCYSKIAASPTKFAEYLASGLPVICTAGIGDCDQVVEEERVGVLLREFNDDAYTAALAAAERLGAEEGLAERCRRVARERFDLWTVGGAKYRRLYRRVLEGRPARAEISG